MFDSETADIEAESTVELNKLGQRVYDALTTEVKLVDVVNLTKETLILIAKLAARATQYGTQRLIRLTSLALGLVAVLAWTAIQLIGRTLRYAYRQLKKLFMAIYAFAAKAFSGHATTNEASELNAKLAQAAG